MSSRRKTPLEIEEIEPAACTVDLRLQILQQLPFFASLAPAGIAAVNEQFRDRGYRPGETIYHSGDAGTHLFVVAAGKVKLLRHTVTGQDVLLEILVPGEFFGSLAPVAGDIYPETAQAQTAVCVLTIGSDAFRDILQAWPAAAMSVLDLTAARLQEAQETVRQLSAYPVEQRIAVTLLKLADKLGEQAEVGYLIQMPLSRDDLAQMTGTTMESASRVMSQFQKEGLVRSGRQWIAITNRSRLETIAGVPSANHFP
jgi:CRP/FNR family transcriptional regulator, nitrogen oxide reductase regulator